jgi:hypothetical protein
MRRASRSRAAISANSSIVLSFLERSFDLGAGSREDRLDLFSLLRPVESPAQAGVLGEAVEHGADRDPFLTLLGPGRQRPPPGVRRRGRSFGGGWRPNPGADETINVPYDIGGRRLA